MKLKALTFANPEKFEVLVTAGSIVGQSRKLVVIGAYIPPGYTQARGRSCLEYIADMLMEVKRKYREPLIVLAGDFNQWPIEHYIEDFIDIAHVPVGPTRGDRDIDSLCEFCKSSDGQRDFASARNRG